jgi:hypothetical protein
MLIDIIQRNVWLSMGIWAILYIGDYTLTIIGAKLYRRSAKQFFTFEKGYELNPVFRQDIKKLRYFSPRFVIFLFITAILILIIWRLSRPFPQLFTFIMGALVLIEVNIHIRHLRNIVLFRLVAQGGAVQGHISYAGWLSYRISAIELFTFAGLYLIVFFLTDSVFFLGGAATCLVTCLKHLWYSRRAGEPVLQHDGENGEHDSAGGQEKS